MYEMQDSHGHQLSDNKRTTTFGKILRFSSLDELPNLINILKNDMSLVGPRPFPVSYYHLMGAEYRKRYLVRPGITGLSQVKGRNSLSWKLRIRYDLEYVKQISFSGDLLILLKTFRYLFSNKANQFLGDESIDKFIPDFDQ